MSEEKEATLCWTFHMKIFSYTNVLWPWNTGDSITLVICLLSLLFIATFINCN